MLKCPECGAEYRVGFVSCADCGTELVTGSTVAIEPKVDRPAREILADLPTARIVEGDLNACREVEEILLRRNLPACIEAAVTEEAALGSASIKRFAVLVAEADLSRCVEVLRLRATDLQGGSGVGAFSEILVNLDADEVTCPACGHVGALQEKCCGDCGLFLGEPQNPHALR